MISTENILHVIRKTSKAFRQNSKAEHRHKSLMDARDILLAQCLVARRVLSDGTEVSIIHPRYANLNIVWEALSDEIPLVVRGKTLEIWLHDQDFSNEHLLGDLVNQISNRFFIRIKLPKENVSDNALCHIINLKLMWGLTILSGFSEVEGYGKALHSNKVLIKSSSHESVSTSKPEHVLPKPKEVEVYVSSLAGLKDKGL